jgi:hypothetical protein
MFCISEWKERAKIGGMKGAKLSRIGVKVAQLSVVLGHHEIIFIFLLLTLSH